MSYKPVRHGRPGIGATHSSRYVCTRPSALTPQLHPIEVGARVPSLHSVHATARCARRFKLRPRRVRFRDSPARCCALCAFSLSWRSCQCICGPAHGGLDPVADDRTFGASTVASSTPASHRSASTTACSWSERLLERLRLRCSERRALADRSASIAFRLRQIDRCPS